GVCCGVSFCYPC
uniref:Chi-conotoxin-like Ar1248 n=2 Tax=Conus araneosus TaxID=101286 RepID=CTA48_CONAO|nr:RecName: Full=Chi-conotoxin-like Ar1248; AltName: Full=Conotoxin Ar1232 [Conus araneosus]